jgi:Fur family ferric uptake transcriptional regulator
MLPSAGSGPHQGAESTASAVILLRSHGLRVTPQRLLLVEVARSLPGHFGAEEVYDRVRAVYPGVSKVSVYRGLDTLREMGLVTCTELGGHAAKYEWAATARHHHLICTACGQLQDLPDEEMNALRERLRRQYGFTASIDHHAIWGRCRQCGEQAAVPAEAGDAATTSVR